jgi:glutaredoxin
MIEFAPAMRLTARSSALWGAALTLTLAALPAHAVYKVVGPDGKVTYTDTPPQDGKAQVKPVATGGGGGAPNIGNLPYELRQAAGRYPVTLYTSAGCRPCDSGRQMLQQRGVPFAEKQFFETSADTAALQSLAGVSSLPVLSIGQQQIKGWVPADWNSYLDAAGYPRDSLLPANYRAPAPTPYVTIVDRPAPSAADAAPAPAADEPTRSTSGPNIRF